MRGRQIAGKDILTEREQNIARLVASGLKNSEIAAEIGTTRLVVMKYLCVIYDKLGLWSRLELALWHEAKCTGAVSPRTD
jgi:DNA-binding NarL/FixJ family response regulator